MKRESLVRIGVAVSTLAPVTARRIRDRWGGWPGAVRAAERGELSERWRDVFLGAEDAGGRAVRASAERGVEILLRGDAGWPSSLQCLTDEPDVLFVRGRTSLLGEPGVAIVGTRESTPGGMDLAERLAGGIGETGWCVVSGLARGIDGAAHRGALAAGGDTIAVLGCGPDVAFPPGHRELQERIAREGLLVSEFAPGVEPRPRQFPRRNRILAALASAVVVVEARLRSGALITARHALDQGKEIFVVPGWPGAPLAAGPLALLRDGARPIRGAADLLEDLGGVSDGPQPFPEEIAALEAIEAGARTPGELARALGIPEPEARDRLARLELLGLGGARG